LRPGRSRKCGSGYGGRDGLDERSAADAGHAGFPLGYF
jgi:hypothetical protein